MKQRYTSPEVEVIEFDTKDVIATSPEGGFTYGDAGDSATANADDGWTGLY